MKKQTIVVVLVFAALLAVGVFSMTRSRERGVSRVDLSQVKTDGVDQITLSGANAAVLVKDGAVWKVNGKAADQRAVTQLLEAVPKIVSSDLVSKSDTRHADLEVDAAKGTSVELTAKGQKVTSFVVGKAASGGTHLRLGDEVYAVSGVYPRTFAKPGAEWLEKRLFPDADANNAEKVQVARAGQPPYTLIKKDTQWVLEDPSVLPKGFRFDPAAATRLASSLVGLRAKDILEADPGADKTGLAEGYDVLTFVLKPAAAAAPAAPAAPVGGGGGAAPAPVAAAVVPAATDSGAPPVTGTIHLGKLNDTDKVVYAKVVGRDEVMTIYDSSVQNLRKSPTDFRDLKMMDFDQAKANKITIVADAKTLVLEKKGAEWAVGKSSDKVPADFALDATAVTRRLSALKNARAQEVTSLSVAAAGLGKPAAVVTVGLEGGGKVELRFGNEAKVDNKEVVYAAGNVDAAVYATNAFTRKNLTGLLDSFKKRADGGGMGGGGLGNIDPSALKNLPPDVRKSLEQQLKQQEQQQKMMEQIQKQMAASEGSAPAAHAP